MKRMYMDRSTVREMVLDAQLRESEADLAAVRAERDALLVERERLREALQPFANATADLDDGTPDRAEIWEMPCAMSIEAGDLRKAWSALNAG